VYRRPESAPDPAFGGLCDGLEAAPVKGLEQKRTNLHEKDDHPIHQIDLLDAEKQVQTLQSAAAEKERLFQAELAAERLRGDQVATRHEEAMAQARQEHQAALDRMDRQLEAEAQRAATERTGLEQRLEVAQADVRQWTTSTLAAQADVQRLTQDLGQLRLELAGAKSEVVELTRQNEEQKVTVYGMASDLEKARERDAAVWLPRLKEFGLRLEREPEAELVRPTWLEGDVWERDVLPLLTSGRVSKK
jgi:chromosome segregation ATPase